MDYFTLYIMTQMCLPLVPDILQPPSHEPEPEPGEKQGTTTATLGAGNNFSPESPPESRCVISMSVMTKKRCSRQDESCTYIDT